MVVDVEQVEPGHHVFAFGCDLRLELVEIFARLQIGGGALVGLRRPRGDLHVVAFDFRVLRDPGEDFAVAPALGQLGLERLGIDAGEIQEPLVERAGVFVFANLAGEERAAFVEDAGQDGVAAEPRARAAGRTLGEIGSGDYHNGLDGVFREPAFHRRGRDVTCARESAQRYSWL